MADAVFFDLDGTLADTAPDLAVALNQLRAELGLPPCRFESLRPFVSQGTRGMLSAGLGILPDHAEYAPLFDRFLSLYAGNLCVHTHLFTGMEVVLDALDERGLPWGVVTNKAERFARPIITALGLDGRCACVVGGDTLTRRKPFPDPLLHAANLARVAPTRSLYVGDDPRDITAGRAAGMRTVGVRYGYLGSNPAIDTWGADALISHPEELLAHL